MLTVSLTQNADMEAYSTNLGLAGSTGGQERKIYCRNQKETSSDPTQRATLPPSHQPRFRPPSSAVSPLSAGGFVQTSRRRFIQDQSPEENKTQNKKIKFKTKQSNSEQKRKKIKLKSS